MKSKNIRISAEKPREFTKRSFGFQRVAWLGRKSSKKFSKWVDVWRGGELASRAATTEGGRETGCRSRCETPDRLFSLLEGSSLTVWPSTGRARIGMETSWNWTISPRNAGKRKKIELCAARLSRRVEPALEVGNPDLNSARQQCRNGKSSHFYGEFDSGSERTLAACLRHASRTGLME